MNTYNTQVSAKFVVEVAKVNRLTGEVTLLIGGFPIEGLKAGKHAWIELGDGGKSIAVGAIR